MKIKRYFAADMRRAIQMVREEQGADAVILSNRKVNGGVEVMAAVDYDAEVINHMAEESPVQRNDSSPISEKDSVVDSPESIKELPLSDVPIGEPRIRSTVSPLRKEIEWSQDPALVAMKDELHQLSGVVLNQINGLAWGEMRQKHPLYVKVMQYLMRMGLSPELCRTVADHIQFRDSMAENWRQAMAFLSSQIQVGDDDILTEGGIVALVGPTGVGKTTTIAKLAARYILRHGSDKVALVTTDCYRIGAYQQLETYGRILGLTVYVANSSEELNDTLEMLGDKQLVLIDTAGVSMRDERLISQGAMLAESRFPIRSYVVLSTTTQRQSQEEVVKGYNQLDFDGVILTKLDETVVLGDALSVAINHQLPISYICDGQMVPEDIHLARANNLVNRGVSMIQESTELPDEERVALTFGDLAGKAYG
ncbi:MAG: flagellar biosynthesis protein FlhF [Chromatiales bacterium]|nr:flagellar biosynthesis protein FlhF [Chromatiales bacterium]